MKSINSTLLAAALLFGATHATAEPIPSPETLAARQYSTLTYEGCYSSSSGLSLNTSYTYNTKGYCQTQCVPAGYSVQATTEKTECYCGNDVPSSSDKVSDSFCNAGCAGYDTEMCGSSDGKYLSVYLTGSGTVGNDDSSSASASASSAAATTSAASLSATPSSTTSAKPSVVTVGGQTIVVTASSTAETSAAVSPAKKSGGASKAGIAAGVVVGVVAIAAIAGGAYFFIRNKKRREVEEEYKRNAAVSSFIAGGKPPTSSAGASSLNDTRLDPVLAHRRMSDGSIADNHDYSRKILKVTNA